MPERQTAAGPGSPDDDDSFAAALRAEWEACGPWVPAGGLTPAGLATQAEFRRLLADDRLAPPATPERGLTTACRWTATPPAVPGWYWWKSCPGAEAEIVYFGVHDGRLVGVRRGSFTLYKLRPDLGGEWAGPLTPPE